MTENSTSLPQDDPVDETSLRYMFKLATPMVITTISCTVMQFVDRRMVAELGTEALAAIVPAGIVSFVPASFALGVMTMLNTFVSQSLGRGNPKECSNYCWQTIYMGLAYFVVTTAFLWPAAPWIFKMMGSEPAVVELEVTYFRIMLYTQFMAVFIWTSSQFFMGIHRPIITMYAAVGSQTVNILANYVLIFGKFGFPAMGIEGAGWGTFIGITVGACIRMYMFLTGRINAEYQCTRSLNVDVTKMISLVKVGFPAGFAFMVHVACLGLILFGLVGRFGKAASAATGAVFSCINVSVMPIVGIATALTAAVGKTIGTGRKDLAAKQTSVCLRIGLIYMGIMGVCFYLFRERIMAFWSDDPEVVRVGTGILICAAIFQVFDAAVITYNGALRGAGDTLWLASVSAVGTMLILGAGGLLILKFFPQLGPLGPWIAFTVNIIVVGLANRWRFKSNRWMKIDLFKHAPGPGPVEIEPMVK